MPAQGPGAPNYARNAPGWSIEMRNNYPIEDYIRDVQMWSMMTDLAPHQQWAALVHKLGGTARVLAQSMPIEAAFRGGNIDGVPYPPVPYLMQGLKRRFGVLDEETRWAAAEEYMSFKRKSGESINELITRFEMVREKAQRLGRIAENIPAIAQRMLIQFGPTPEELNQLLGPYGTRIPATEPEYQHM